MVVAVPHLRFRLQDVVNRMPQDVPWELVRGELRMMSPAGSEHGRIAMQIGTLLNQHVRQHKLGRVYGAETGFVLSETPATLRAPDAAFVRHERTTQDEAGFFVGPPDLAVEVVSPSQTEAEVMEKARMWIESGSALVWIIWPRTQSVTVLTPAGGERIVQRADQLDGGDVVPGFRCSVAEIFE